MMFGISVYFSNQPSSKLEAYIEKMNKIGCKSIFTSLHIPEDDHSLYRDRLKHLGTLAKKFDMELFADISPKSLQYLGFNWENTDQLTNWGVTGIRVDYGICEEVIAELSKKMKIALNASTLTEESLAKLKKSGLQVSSVEAWHNFYPRPETGLDIMDFSLKNQFLSYEGIRVMAFIPGDGERRGPLFQGLPTLEAHRNLTTFASYLDLTQRFGVDKIIIGDPSISEASYEQFSAYFVDGVILLRAESYIKDENLLARFSSVQTNRVDAARDVIRSAESRLMASPGTTEILASNTIERSLGSITIDNCRYGRYQGEIQITKKDLPADEKVNVVGRIIEDDRPLLSNIKGGVKFKILWNH